MALQATTLSSDRLTQYWCGLLARKQYTRYELINKARSKGYSAQEITESLEEISRRGLIRDDIAANAISALLTGRKGKRVLAIKLKQKGVDEDIINSLTDEYQEVLSSSEKEKIKRKYWGIENKYERSTKIGNYLRSRGYTNTQELLGAMISEWEI